MSQALSDASAVVDVSNSPSWEDAAVLEFFMTSTRNQLAGEAEAGVGHHVALSVVGSERMTESGYFRAKLAQEELIKSASVPHSIVRATQFFEFVNAIADFSTQGNQDHLPSGLIQPMAADDMASALCDIAMGPPVDGTLEVGGPEQFHLDDMVRRALAARHDPRQVVADPRARYYGVELRARTLLPDEGARLGDTRFDDWLRESMRQQTAAYAAGAGAS